MEKGWTLELGVWEGRGGEGPTAASFLSAWAGGLAIEEGQGRTTQVQASPSCDCRSSKHLAAGGHGSPALSLPVLIPT